MITVLLTAAVAVGPFSEGGTELDIAGLLIGVILLASGGLCWPLVESRDKTRRAGTPEIDRFHASARLLLVAMALAALAALGDVFAGSGDAAALSPALLLVVGLAVLAGSLSLPAASLSKAQRNRGLLDGTMITTGAASFFWYFFLGRSMAVDWSNAHDTVVALAFPGLDIVLVAALLVVSSKSRLVVTRIWGPLAAGVGLLLAATCVWQAALLAGSSVALAFVGPCQVVAILFLAVATVRLARSDGWSGLNEVSLARRPGLEPDAEDGTRIWHSLLPYALVPANAAMAVYAWQRNLASNVTGGIIAATALLVALTFVRQLLAAKENHRLYEQAASAYENSLAYADNVEQLYVELRDMKEELVQNNGKLTAANERLHDLATTDPLTGLPNHRAMVTVLDKELDRARRYERPCSLLFLDLDHFKALNDSRGHLCGDAVLREIIKPIGRGLRAADVAGRWGGEEFVVVLPETQPVEALAVAERVCALVSQHPFRPLEGEHLTCSIGIASYPYDAQGRESLIEAADRAMYTAKRLGKNQVRTATDPSEAAFSADVPKGFLRDDFSVWGMVEALTTLVRAHDPADDEEAAAISDLCIRVATEMGMPAAEIRSVGLAARLHDVGITSMQVSGSEAARLDSELIEQAERGADMVARIPALAELAPIIRGHHERWDGTGGPDGLHGEHIPIGSRIIAVCDAFHMLMCTGDDGEEMQADAALLEMESMLPSRFDRSVVSALRAVMTAPEEELPRAS